MCKGEQRNKSKTFVKNEVTTTKQQQQEEEQFTSFKKKFIITRNELKSHNRPNNAWCAVHGKVMDISTFARRHPGGDVILLSAGSDATVLFETYHPRGVSSSLLEKLQIGVLGEDELHTSFYSWNSDFYPTMKKRVVQRLEQIERPRRGGMEIWIKAMFLLCGFWYSLIRMYLSSSDFKQALWWCCVMGIFASFIGTCIQHDGNHAAFAQNKWLNKAAGWTMDMIGASAFTWEMQHMLGHHPYTNVLDCAEDAKKNEGVDCPLVEKDPESDPDVFSSFPLMRMHPVHEPKWFHKYQHLYAPLLFALMTLSKVFEQDFAVASEKRLYHIDATSRYGSKYNIFRFWFMKALTVLYMIILPIYFHGFVRGSILFLIGHMVCGEMLATMFIVNHVIEGVAFAKKNHAAVDAGENTEKQQQQVQSPEFRPVTAMGITPMEKTREPSKNVPLNDWAAVQCQTSVNWSPGSWFWNHFSGGLSHQIEHHLFPSICHTNYFYIQDVVEQTCLEYGVPYQSEPSLFHAYKKMLQHLKQMGFNNMKEKKS